MRLAVFGETDRTTRSLVSRALHAGYTVDVLANSNTDMRPRNNLNVTKGSASRTQDVRKIIRRADAALCLLQNPRDALDTKTRTVIQNIVESMQEYGTRRLVIFSCIHDTDDVSQVMSASMLKRMLAHFFTPHVEERNVAALLQQTMIDWTIVGHPPLVTTLHDDIAESKSDPEAFRKLLASHMISQITDVAYVRSTIMIPV